MSSWRIGSSSRVYLNNNGTLTDSGQRLSSFHAREVSLGDVDGDGDLDAFLVSRFGEANLVWLNDGGTFTDSGQRLGNSDSYGVSLGDVDQDGDLDAYVANYGANRVWLNHGGVFTQSGQALGTSASNQVSLGDLDGDGDLDAFVANSADSRIWFNDMGTFTAGGQTFSGRDSRDVGLGDFDNDGDLDVFVTNDSQPNDVLINDGGTFTDSGQPLGDGISRGLALGDVDGDGDLDAFVVNVGQPDRVYLNEMGIFRDSGFSLGSSIGYDVALGDFDGDGDLDSVIANANNDSQVWLNQIPEYDSIVLSESPIGYWRLGESSGTVAADSSSNGLDGTYVNGVILGVPGTLVGDLNTATQFGASASRVRIANDALFSTTELTVEAFVKLESAGNNDGIVMKTSSANWNDGYGLYHHGGQVHFFVNHYTNGISADITSGEFVHVAATYDGSNMRLLFNGVEVATQAYSTPINHSNGQLSLGWSPSAGAYSLNGTLDEVAVYGQALPVSTLLAHYEQSLISSDVTPPTLLSFTRQAPSDATTNADTLVFLATFDEVVEGVDVTDFDINGTTTATVTAVSVVTASTYEVTISGGDLAGFSGDVELDLASGQDIADTSGNELPTVEPVTDEGYTLDNTAPVLTSFTRQTPAGPTTNADTLVFLATFDEDVMGVDATDFAVNGTTTATVTAVDSVTASTYEVTISGGDLVGLNEDVGLDLALGQDITDIIGNVLPNTEPAIDEGYTLDNAAPVLTSFTRQTPTAPTTNADTLVFLATFDEEVMGVDATDFEINGTTTATVTAVNSVTASTYEVSISGGDLAGFTGDVGLDLASGQDIADVPGNELPNTEPAIDEGYTLDNTTPVLTSFIRQTPNDSTTNADTLVFLATFNEDVMNVDATDFDVHGTTTATVTAVSVVTASTYEVTISGGDLAGFNGDVGLELASGQDIADSTGNALPTAEPAIDEVYRLDNTAPVLTSFTRQIPTYATTYADTLVFLATFDENVTDVDAADFQVDGSSSAMVTAVNSLGPNTYEVTVSGGDLADFVGAVGLNVADGQNITDIAGNALPANEPANDESYSLNGTLSYDALVLQSNPVGYWRLGESFFPLSAADQSVNQLDGSYVGNYILGQDGALVNSSDTATSFGASGSRVTVPDHPALHGDSLTLEAFVKLEGAGNNDGIVTKTSSAFWNDGYGLYHHGGQVHFFVNHHTNGIAADITSGEFVHVAATYDGSNMRLLFNGVEVATQPYSTPINHSNGPLSLGWSPSAGAYSLNGTLDEVAVYGQALPVSTLLSHYQRSQGSGGEDVVAPTLLSFTRQIPAGTTTNADTLVFLATFDEDVMGVDATDFEVNGTTTATVTAVSVVTASTYEITISGGDLAGFNGGVELDLASGQDITDTTGNSLPITEPAIDEAYILDNTAPALTSFTRQSPSDATTNADTLVFLATFDEDVIGVDMTDFQVDGTSTAAITAVASVTASTYEVTVSGGDLNEFNGAVGLNLANAQNVTDAVGNALPAAEPATDEGFTVDNSIPYSDLVLSSNPVGYWRLGELSGTVASDASVNGLNGAYVNAVVQGADGALVGDADTASLFGANASRISIANDALLSTTELTIEAFVKLEGAGNNDGIVMKTSSANWNDGYGVYHHGGQVHFFVNHYTNGISANITSGEFVHVAATYDGSNMRLLFNGVEVASQAYSTPINHSNRAMSLGWSPSAGAYSLNAALDEVAIYGQALPASTLLGHYQQSQISSDFTPPTLVSFARQVPSGATTNEDTLVFLATFDEDVMDVDATDFDVNGTTTATATAVNNVTASTYEITISGGDLAGFNGDVGLDLASSQDIADTSGNGLPTTEPAIDEAYMLDNAAPVLTSITRQTPADATTNADTLVLLATFDEDVTGVDAADFQVEGTTTATVTVVNSVTASTYEITISGGDLAGFSGDVGLDLASGQDIADTTGNDLQTAEPAIDEAYTLDNTAPVLTSFTRQTPTDATTNLDILVFLATFDEDVTGVDATDFQVNGTTTATITAVNSLTASTYEVTISGGDLAGFSSDVGLDLAGGQDITDTSGNALPTAEPVSDEVYTLDNAAPVLTSLTRQTPTDATTNEDTLVLLATFDKDVLNVDATDFQVDGTTTATITAVTSLTASTYEITISGGDLAGFSGDVGLDLAGGQDIADSTGNDLPTAEPAIDEAYTLDNAAPVLTSFTRQNPTDEITNADTLVFLATFDEDVTGVDATDLEVDGTTRATITAVMSVTPSTYEVTVSGGDLQEFYGAVGLNLASGQNVTDTVGNALPVAEPATDEVFTVDNSLDYNEVVLSSNPVGYWRLGELSGTVASDSSINGLNGTYLNAVAQGADGALTDDSNTATQFGANASRVSISNDALFSTTELTIEAFVKLEGAGNNDGIVMKTSSAHWNDGYGLYHHGGQVHFFVNHYSNGISANITSGEFVHVAATYDGSNMRLHLNGVEVASQPYGTPINHSNGALSLGWSPSAGAYSLNGTLDEVAVYGQALPATRLLLHYLHSQGTPDTEQPFVESFTRFLPSDATTDADALVFQVKFNEVVLGVDVNDFVLEGQSTAVIDSVSVVTPTTFDVHVSGGDLQNYNGTVGLNLSVAPSITDIVGRAVIELEPDVDESFEVENPVPYEELVIADHPVGYWRLGESSGLIAVDSSTNGFDGSYVNNVQLQEVGGILGDADTASLFGDAAARVSVPHESLFSSSSLTVEALVRADDAGNNDGIVLKTSSALWNDGYGLYFGGGKLHFFLNHYTNEIAANFDFQQYVHVVATFDGSNMRLYFDGVEVASKVSTTPINHSNAPLSIGWSPSQPTYSFNGALDEVAVYDQALSEAAILRHSLQSKNAMGNAVAPTMASFEREQPSDPVTDADMLVFSLTFDEAVTNVQLDDFLVDGATTASVTSVVTMSPREYQITVAGGDLPELNGMLRLLLSPDHGITDLGGTPLSVAIDVTSEFYGVSNSIDYDQVVLADDPVAYWRLGETSGTVAHDSSGNGLEGTYATEVVLGAPGGLATDSDTAAQFGVANATVTVPHSSLLNPASITVEALVKLENPVDYDAILLKTSASWTNGYGLYYLAGQIHFFVNHHPNSVSTPIIFGEYVHIAATFDGAKLTLYKDGVEVHTQPYTQAIIHGSETLQMGAGPSGNNYWFDGVIDEVAVYDQALTPEAIAEHFEASSSAENLSLTTPDQITVQSETIDYSAGGIVTQTSLLRPELDNQGRLVVDLDQSSVAEAEYHFDLYEQLRRSDRRFYETAANGYLLVDGESLSETWVKVDPSSSYHLSGTSFDLIETIELELGYAAYDADSLSISSQHVSKFAGSTDSYLLADITPGATSILVNDASGWSQGDYSTNASRVLAWYGYMDSVGNQHSDYTYTRNTLGSSLEAAWQSDGIQPDAPSGGHRIFLSQPWAGALVPSGTAVRNAVDGSDIFLPETSIFDRQITLILAPPGTIANTSQFESHLGGDQWNPELLSQKAFPPGTMHVRLSSNAPIHHGVLKRVDNGASSLQSQFTFQGLNRNVGSRSFQRFVADQSLAVNPTVPMSLSSYVSFLPTASQPVSSETHSLGFQAYDRDGLLILPEHVQRYPGTTDTQLAAPLLPGHTQIQLADGTGWDHDSIIPGDRILAWFGYAGSDGVVHADYTYTRNIAGDSLAGLWSMGGIVGNTIQLNEPWGGPALAAGTAIRNATDGDALYPAILDNGSISAAGQRLTSAPIGGTWTGGVQTLTAWPPGTASIRAAAVLNQSSFLADDAISIESFYATTTPLVSSVPAAGQHTLVLDLIANDPVSQSGQTELFAIGTPQFGTASIMPGGLVEYRAAPYFIGTDQFTYSIWDAATNQGYTETARIVVHGNNVESDPSLDQQLLDSATLDAIGRRPIAYDDTYTTAEFRAVSGQRFELNTALLRSLSSNDGSARLGADTPVALSLTRGPSHGSLSLGADGTMTYQSDEGFVGVDSFEYAIFDGVQIDTATAYLEVKANAMDFVLSNLETLSQGMWRHHQAYNQLPVLEAGPSNQSYVDENGKPFLSWRVHLLPWVGYRDLYEQFALNEPWDSPHNQPLASLMPDIYGDGTGEETNLTRIQTIVAPRQSSQGTNWGTIGFNQDEVGIRYRDVLDGLSNVVMFIQTGSDKAVVWTAPEDAEFDYDDPIATVGEVSSYGIPAVTFSRQTTVLPADIDTNDFGALASRSGLTSEPLPQPSEIERELDPIRWDVDGQRQDQNLREIAYALNNYHSAYNTLPISQSNIWRDANGHPYLSWRVHLLPFVEGQELYERFNLDEPWDSPNNLPLLDEMPDVYRSFGESVDSNTTRFKIPIGIGAAFGLDANGSQISNDFGDFRDGFTHTLLVLETGPDQAVAWTRPLDFEFDASNAKANLGSPPEGFFRAVGANGTVIHLPNDIDEDTLQSLVTIDSQDFYGTGNIPVYESIDINTLKAKYDDLNAADVAIDRSNAMKWIGLALHNYSAAYNQLPIHDDPSNFDAEGRPYLSWRVHVLPFLDHYALYQQFNLDEPWDSANNLPLLEYMPDVYRGVEDDWDSVLTRIQTFVDGGTAEFGFRDGAPFSSTGDGPQFRDFLDGTSNTFLFVESGPDVAVPWTKPVDITLNKEDPYSTLGDIGDHFWVSFADGAVELMPRLTDENLILGIVANDRELMSYQLKASSNPVLLADNGGLTSVEILIADAITDFDDDINGSVFDVIVDDPTVVSVSTAMLDYSDTSLEPTRTLTLQAVPGSSPDGIRSTIITIGDLSFEVTVFGVADPP